MRGAVTNSPRNVVPISAFLSLNQTLINREEIYLDHPQYLNAIQL